MTEDASSLPKRNPLRKGVLVKVNRKKYQGSLESLASDEFSPQYIFEGPGEVLSIKGDFAQIRWRKPVPDVWLRLDQLEIWASKDNF